MSLMRFLIPLLVLFLPFPATHAQTLPSLLDAPGSRIVARSNHSCALTDAGAVECWGMNDAGQLGDGSTEHRSTPVNVVGLSPVVVDIAAGYRHTCVLTSTGAVKCWGANNVGQLGNGSTTGSNIPVNVTGLSSGVAALAAWGDHTCALTSSGGVKCWGLNDDGQLGDQTTTNRTTPVSVTGLDVVVSALATGDSHTCALTQDAKVKCWGFNHRGQLGDGTTTMSLLPVDASALAPGVIIIAIAAANHHTCAVAMGGKAICWGDNMWGQTGSPDIWNILPMEVLSVGVTAITTGSYHTCALSDGGLKCWGRNIEGQLGSGATSSHLPIDVIGLDSGVVSVTAGSQHTCAMSHDSAVTCWGANSFGQVGDGTVTRRYQPMDVIGLSSEFIAMSTGWEHTCALTRSGSVKCWGRNRYGQLGNDSLTDSTTPVDVIGLGSEVVAIGSGESSTCALTRDGATLCWGRGDSGELGNGALINSTTPVHVAGLNSDVTAIGVGWRHACALISDGRVKCWGQNDSAQLGNGYLGGFAVAPQDVVNLGLGATSIAAGLTHTCAVIAGGSVKCWGWNVYGAVGNGSAQPYLTASDVQGLSAGVTHLVAGWYHTCAVVDGGLKCWGGNAHGQIGNASALDQFIPVDVHTLSTDVSGIAAGGTHTCAVLGSGAVKCWGSNSTGQLGDGSGTPRNVPVNTSGLNSGVTELVAGGDRTCAKTHTGAVYCWGRNLEQQLGLGDAINRFVPVLVRGGQHLDFAPGTPTILLHTVLRGETITLSAISSGGGNVPIVFHTWTPETCSLNGNQLTANGRTSSLCGVSVSRAGGSDSLGGTLMPAATQHRLLRIARNDLLTVQVSGQGQVDVSPDPHAGGNGACDANTSPCTASYRDGDANELTFSATPGTGWHLDAWADDCSTASTDALHATLMLDADLSCTALFAINHYTVRFIDWNGMVLDTQDVTHGSAATPPTPPDRPGYFFLGWDTSLDSITSDLTVTAQYEIDMATSSDLSIHVQVPATLNYPGDTLHFILHVENTGPSAASNAKVGWTPPEALLSVEWLCIPEGMADCSAEGTGAIDDTIDLPAGIGLSYLIQATLPIPSPTRIESQAQVSTDPDQPDPNPDNDIASWQFHIDGLFLNGFEPPK